MKKFLFLFFCICLFNCRTTLKNQSNLSETVKYEKSTLGSLRELMQSIEVIRLDHQNSIALGQFVHVLHRDSSFYIGDLAGSKLIYRFKENGQFTDSIGKQGKGPGEYLDLRDFYVDDSTNDIFILSHPDICLYHFDKAGKFLNRKTAPYRAESFTKCQNHFWIYMGFNNGHSPKRVAQFDTALIMTHSYLPLSTQTIPVILGPSFVEWKKQSFLFMPFDPNIYQIQGDSIVPIVHFDYENKSIPKNYWQSTDPMQAILDLQNKGFCNIHTLLINDRYILVEHIEQIGSENMQSHYLCSIKNRETGKWNWIRQDASNLGLIVNEQAKPTPQNQPTWYINKVKGFSKDGRLMLLLNGFELDALTQDDYALIRNPEQLENINPEMDVFLFLCTLK